MNSHKHGQHREITACYLCGEPLGDDRSRDHAVPKALIERSQPIAKGFEFGGFVPTHRDCNNQFGPETYAARAMELLSAIGNEDREYVAHPPGAPGIAFRALNAESLGKFTPRDLKYFEIIDFTDQKIDALKDPEYFKDKPPSRGIERARHVAASVLTKSVAALAMRTSLVRVPPYWRVHFAPFQERTGRLDLDNILKGGRQFDIGVKAWVKTVDTDEILAAYRYQEMVCFLLIGFAPVASGALRTFLNNFGDTDVLVFEGPRLVDMLTKGWRVFKRI